MIAIKVWAFLTLLMTLQGMIGVRLAPVSPRAKVQAFMLVQLPSIISALLILALTTGRI